MRAPRASLLSIVTILQLVKDQQELHGSIIHTGYSLSHSIRATCNVNHRVESLFLGVGTGR
jgi:hypothetical protein